jgi:predicted lysophospholipase L1 biosynthesis ABC-type transport system permease subunit
LVLAASMDHLFRTPAAYGWTWDYIVSDVAAAGLVDDPEIESVGLVTVAPIVIDGRPVYTRGVESLKGELPVQIVDGRHAQAGEIVLGARTMADLGVGIGDTIVAEGPVQREELRVVGEAVLAGVIDVPEAGWGAAVPQATLDELGVGSSDVTQPTSGVIALAPGADADAVVARLTEQDGQAPHVAEEPVELARLDEIEDFPRLLTVFLAALGLVAAGHAVVVTARQRRADLAVLRAMGMIRRNVYQALFVVGAALGAVGVLLGVPVGVAAGQLLWRRVASSLGVVVVVDVPWWPVLLAAAAACAVVALLALLPARRIVHSRPAHALRTE